MHCFVEKFRKWTAGFGLEDTSSIVHDENDLFITLVECSLFNRNSWNSYYYYYYYKKEYYSKEKNAFQSFYTNIYIDSHRYSSFCSILSPSRVIEILHKIRFTRSSAFSSTSCQSDRGSLDDKDIDDDDDDDDDTAVSDNALTLSSRSEY